MKYKSIIKNINDADKSKLSKINVTTLSNISLEPYFNLLLVKEFIEDNIYPYITSISYQEYYKNKIEIEIEKADLIIIWLDFEELYPSAFNDIYSGRMEEDALIDLIINLCNQLFLDIRSITYAQIIWLGFEDYFSKIKVVTGNVFICNSIIDKINNKLFDQLSKNLTYVDFKRLIAGIGISNAYDNKSRYRWNSPYSQQLIQEVAIEIKKQYLIANKRTKKCIIFDCDNVLWGGILSEDGIKNIQLGNIGVGRPYQDFQRYLLSLYYHGIILTICSKNDIDDIMTIFNCHSGMILKEEHISCFQVNWLNKFDNIVNISKILNIGFDSMVFVDDSKFEIELINRMLPEVTTILYDKNNIYEHLSCFNLYNKVNIDNIKQRNNTYKTAKQREDFKSKYSDYNEYLKDLNMVININKATPIEYNRISELSLRTNKCTNGKRYTLDKLNHVLESKSYFLYSITLKDRFSDLGLVGAIGIVDNYLDLFCLSCRALGRYIENEMIIFIHQNFKTVGYYFDSTNKNNDILEELNNNFK